MICYGHENRHKELRARLCVEAVLHKDYYLDNDYLNLHGKYSADIVEYLAIVSESYNSVAQNRHWNTHIQEKIYEHETLNLARDGQYCSMWQVYQAANVLARPIISIFPTGTLDEFWSRTNRIVYPIQYCLRQKDPVAIMWTKTRSDLSNPNHFVPVLSM